MNNESGQTLRLWQVVYCVECFINEQVLQDVHDVLWNVEQRGCVYLEMCDYTDC